MFVFQVLRRKIFRPQLPEVRCGRPAVSRVHRDRRRCAKRHGAGV